MPDQLETVLLSRQEQTQIVTTLLPELLSSKNESSHPEFNVFYYHQPENFINQ